LLNRKAAFCQLARRLRQDKVTAMRRNGNNPKQIETMTRRVKNAPVLASDENFSSDPARDLGPEIFDLKHTLNTMVDQLNDFAAEVNRAAQEVGTEHPWRRQGQAPAVAGAWKDLAGNFNLMAANLAGQTRSAFKIFVVHEDTLTGVRAAAVLGRLADYLDHEPVIQNEIWKFDSLAHPALYEQASEQAIAADMIIVSAGGGQALPAHVEDLVADALAHKQGRPAAVVALLDLKLQGAAEPSPVCARLRQLAENAGVDFFCNTGESYWANDTALAGPGLLADGILNYS
jgi:hypothetical protein